MSGVLMVAVVEFGELKNPKRYIGTSMSIKAV